MNTEVDTARRPNGLTGLQKYGVLLMGIFLIILSGGRFITPSAAFFAPIFLLLYTRNTSVKKGMAMLYTLLFLSLLVRLLDYLAVPRPFNVLFIAGFAALELLPFYADRTLRGYLPTFLRPLVLPSVFVVSGLLLSPFMPFGSMGEKAYSQVGNSELVQLLAFTGTHGVTFVIFWFAATMASFWDSGFVWQRNRTQVRPLVVCLMVVLVAGGFRTIFDENDSPTVRMAGVIVDQTSLKESLQEAGVGKGYAGLMAAGIEREQAQAALDAHINELFLQSGQLAEAGASIVTWAEASAVMYKSQEPQFNATSAALAQRHNIYLVTAIAVLDDSSIVAASAEEKPVENKLLVFGPNGDNLGQYIKAKSLWNENNSAGDGMPLVLDTPHGKLAFSIGFDLDFPALIRQTGDADILIAPAADWRALTPHHALMATFRGVENGLSVFRPANKGMSIASDSHGRILARTDHFLSSSGSFYAEVPTAGIDTFYTRAGDWFAWFTVCLLLLLVLLALLAARKRKKRPPGASGPDADDERDRSRITAIQWREAERDNNLHRNN